MSHAADPGAACRLTRGTVSGRAFLEKRTIHVADLAAELESEFPDAGYISRNSATARRWPYRLLRDGEPLGVILIRRKSRAAVYKAGNQLLETFADQAVIAIENTRLFEEVQARNMELRTALEQQTATSELLKVIRRSTFDLQPVFDTLAENAVRLCSAERTFVHRFDGQFLRVVATHDVTRRAQGVCRAEPDHRRPS